MGYGNVKLNLPVSLNTGMDWITETASAKHPRGYNGIHTV